MNTNAGKIWSKIDDELLIKLYNIDKLKLIEIAQIHKRAPGSIVSRLLKKSIVKEKKEIRGYDAYIKNTLSTNSTNKEEKKSDSEELIIINDEEYILSNGKVYEIKKIKGKIYGQYDEKTQTVKILKSYITKIIDFLLANPSINTVLYSGDNDDFNFLKEYFPNIIFEYFNYENNKNIKFNLCIITDLNMVDNLDLFDSNTNFLIFESKKFYDHLIKLLETNNIKIIDSNQEFTNKTIFIRGIKKNPTNKGNIIVLDTETTGFPQSRDPKEYEKFNDARLIELGYIIYNSNGEKIKEYNSLVKPDKWIIKNSFVHGITQIDANTKGKNINIILEELSIDLNNISIFVCHNINFDMSIILAEAHRAKKLDLVKKIESKEKICTMDIGKNFMSINKKPKLIELYKFIFNQEFIQEHRALSDCVACADCFHSMTYNVEE